MPTPETIAALSFFGAMVVCPLVYMLMKHQRTIAEIVHRSPQNDLAARLEAIERELRELKAVRHSDILAEDDRRELQRRTS